MRNLVVMAVVIGAGALSFAAASQAGISLKADQSGKAAGAASDLPSMYEASGCRIEKTIKYDFSGNPYLKKVRVCA